MGVGYSILVIESEILQFHDLWLEYKFFWLCNLANGQYCMCLEEKSFRVVARTNSASDHDALSGRVGWSDIYFLEKHLS